jgi:uncharacterized protein YceK
MKNEKRVLLSSILCVFLIMTLSACAGNETHETSTETGTEPETEAGVLLQISEKKTGWSIAGEELPPQNNSEELRVEIKDKVYAGLTKNGDDNTRCILTIMAISEEGVTVETLENQQVVSRVIQYEEVFEYPAFSNPDEYSYVYTIQFVK